jgi:hypothetical protein
VKLRVTELTCRELYLEGLLAACRLDLDGLAVSALEPALEEVDQVRQKRGNDTCQEQP